MTREDKLPTRAVTIMRHSHGIGVVRERSRPWFDRLRSCVS